MPKRWSTKTLRMIEPPTRERTGEGIFEFTDHYSVFHYGRMPDEIPGKGEAVCRMAVHTLRLLAAHHIPTHLISCDSPTHLRVRVVRVINPSEQSLSHTDYNRFIPLQVVYRNSLPLGASVFRRLEQGTVSLGDLGLSRYPEPGQILDSPIIEFTTKLEEIDRFIDEQEAQRLAGLSDAQLAEVKRLTLQVNHLITNRAATVGLAHADGKVEFGIDDTGAVMLVDTAGTPDENRFLWNDKHVSKQVLRDFYATSGLERRVQGWVATGRGRDTWPPPSALPAAIVAIAEKAYKSLCEVWTGEQVWNAPSLDEVISLIAGLNSSESRY